MTLRKGLTVLSTAAMVAVALFMSSCDDTTTTPTILVPSAPSNMAALAVNETTIRLTFSPSASESNVDFVDYQLTVTNGGSSTTSSVVKGTAYIDIMSLTAGKVYTFSLRAKGKDSSSVAVKLDWATAQRFNGVRAYDKASTLGSGINLINGTNQNVAAGDLWDLCFDSSDSTFGAPSASSYVKGGLIGGKTPKVTYIFAKDISNFYTVNADSLNQVYETKALNDTSSVRKLKIEGMASVNTTSGAKSFVMYALTGDNHFAKVLVKAVGGMFVQKDSNGSFVEIDASVQQTSNIPYALKNNFGFDGAGTKSTKIMHVTNN